MLRVKLVKSIIGNTPRNRATVKALGLRKMHQTVVHKDTPAIRGMIHHVKHLLEVEEVKE
jgi:large subunit ribosomal protein L30